MCVRLVLTTRNAARRQPREMQMDNGMPQGSVVSINEPPGSQVMPPQQRSEPREAKGKKKRAKIKAKDEKKPEKSKKRSRR